MLNHQRPNQCFNLNYQKIEIFNKRLSNEYKLVYDILQK